MRSMSWSSRARCGALPLIAGLLATACSDEEPKAKAGQACKVDADCEASLVCRAQICTSVQVSDMNSANNTSDMGGDMTTPVAQPERYSISFVRYSEIGDDKGKKFLYVLDTQDDTAVKVSDDASLCQLSCWPSRDLRSLAYLRQSSNKPGAFDVYVTSIDASFKAQGSGSLVIEGAERVEVVHDTIGFVRDEGGAKRGYTLKFGSSQETLIADLGAAAGTLGTIAFDDIANKAVVYKPTLQSLEISIGALGPISASTYTIDASNYQEVGGSYFSATPTAFSPDGKTMALLTRAPNNYNICETGADCTGLGQHCGVKKRCTAIENTVHFFDLENLANLGQSCDTDARCGGVHECYIPSNAALDQAVCIPRRVVVGLPLTPAQPRNNPTAKGGCENTAGNAARPYTSLSSPLSFDASGNLYVVGQRECAGLSGELNIPDTDILRFNPRSKEFKVVYGNPGQNFNDMLCYDPVERRVDVARCVTYIKSAILSPLGRELAFLATNPNVTDASKAVSNHDVWTVLSDGTRHEWNGKGDLFDRVERHWVHPRP